MALYCGICLLIAIPVGQRFDWSTLWGGFDEFVGAVSDHIWMGHASGVLGLWIALWWCYFVVGWGLLGATPGKWAMGMRIMDYHQRCPIGPARATLRLAAYCVSSITFEWGHLLMLIRTDRRTLHDILAGTRVVRKSRRQLRKVAAEAAAAVGGADDSGEMEIDKSKGASSSEGEFPNPPHENHRGTEATESDTE